MRRRAFLGGVLAGGSAGSIAGAAALGCTARIGSAPVRPSVSALRVLTLNIAHGRGRAPTQTASRSAHWYRKNLDAIAAVLRRESADVVALQEAELGSHWAGDFDHVAHLAAAAGYPHAIAHAHMDVPARWRYGTAILSRHAIVEHAGASFASQARWRKGWSRITIALRSRPLDVCGVHLDFSSARIRREQTDELAGMLQERPHPRIVMGDFNAGPREALIDGLCLRASLQAAAPDDHTPTLVGSRRRIDWILASTSLQIVAHTVTDDRVSDHRPVIADLQV